MRAGNRCFTFMNFHFHVCVFVCFCSNLFFHDVMDWSLSCMLAFSGHIHSFYLPYIQILEIFAKCYHVACADPESFARGG